MSLLNFHNFIFVFLHTEANFTFDNEEIKIKSQKGHFDFQREMMQAKKLLFSGPLDDTGGLYFFASNLSKDEVSSLLHKDPLVKIGLLVPEIHIFSTPSFKIQVLDPGVEIINNFYDEIISKL